MPPPPAPGQARFDPIPQTRPRSTSISTIVTLAPSNVRSELFTPPLGGAPGEARTELLRLGRARQPWGFLARATRWLEGNPADEVVRFLVAANAGELGLRTIARAQVDRLSASARAQAGVRELTARIDALAPDEVEFDERAANLSANLAALGARGIDLSAHWGAWRERLGGTPAFRASDENVVRADPASPLASAFVDHAGFAREVIASAPGVHERDPQPVVVEGFDPPWAFVEAMRATAGRPLGQLGRVDVVHLDPVSFLDALSLRDLGGLILEARAGFFVGADAARRALDAWRSRLDERLSAIVVAIPGLSGPTGAREALATALAEQEREALRLRAAVEAAYADATPASWRDRFAGALDGSGPPARFAIPTTRFSTFIRHSAEDLARALRRRGCVVDVLVEAGEHQQRSIVSYLRAFERTRPDATIVINYPRACVPGMVPDAVPHVCWIQDAMPHLFDDRVGASQGPLDYLVGHLHQELFDRFGYPRERAIPAPVLADVEKFHDGPADPALERDLACEIGVVSHHGEPTRAMFDRLMRDHAGDDLARRVFTRVFEGVGEIVERAMVEPPQPALRALVDRAIADAGGDADARLRDQVLRHCAIPLADRVMRHQSVAWAIDLAQRRGWRVNLYGRGWAMDPRFEPYARGELEHGESLRAAYRAARVHLHASLHTMVHQRAMECFLSGGVCVARLTLDTLTMVKAAVQLALVDRPLDIADGEREGYLVDKHPEARAYAALRAAVGAPDAGPIVWTSRARLRSMGTHRATIGPEQDPRALYGDLAGSAYWDRDSFERVVTRAVEDDAWRDAAARAGAERVRRWFTYDGVVDRLLRMLAGRPAGSAAFAVGSEG